MLVLSPEGGTDPVAKAERGHFAFDGLDDGGVGGLEERGLLRQGRAGAHTRGVGRVARVQGRETGIMLGLVQALVSVNKSIEIYHIKR